MEGKISATKSKLVFKCPDEHFVQKKQFLQGCRKSILGVKGNNQKALLQFFFSRKVVVAWVKFLLEIQQFFPTFG